MHPFYVDVREHVPRGHVLQVRHIGIVRGLDKEHAAEIAALRFAHELENPAQFIEVTRMERPASPSAF